MFPLPFPPCPKRVGGGGSNRPAYFYDTFYDNLKGTDLVCFMSYMKTLRGYIRSPVSPHAVLKNCKISPEKSGGRGVQTSPPSPTSVRFFLPFFRRFPPALHNYE